MDRVNRLSTPEPILICPLPVRITTLGSAHHTALRILPKKTVHGLFKFRQAGPPGNGTCTVTLPTSHSQTAASTASLSGPVPQGAAPDFRPLYTPALHSLSSLLPLDFFAILVLTACQIPSFLISAPTDLPLSICLSKIESQSMILHLHYLIILLGPSYIGDNNFSPKQDLEIYSLSATKIVSMIATQ